MASITAKYPFLGTKAKKSTADSLDPVTIEGAQYQIQQGYYVPYYEFQPRFDASHKDEEHVRAIRIFARRFFRHVDPSIDIPSGTDASLALAKEDYEHVAPGYRKEKMGAVLVGRMVRRLERLCQDWVVAKNHLDDPESEAKREARKIAEKKIKEQVEHYSIVLMDNDLLQCVWMRPNRGTIDDDDLRDPKGEVIPEMIGEITKVASMTATGIQPMMINTRATKNGRAMEAMDKTGTLMKTIIAGHREPGFPVLKRKVDNFIKAAKARGSIAKFDKEAFGEANAAFDRARDDIYSGIKGIRVPFGSNAERDLQELRRAAGYIERMAEVRVPITSHFGRLEAYTQAKAAREGGRA